uniref:Tc1-like transposase DDE domain-containing protein n=1 Tax=Gasterosteus aculeatus aculeatus TaxID=481459 RepID=A0AAQ4PAV4_GASAC
MKGATVSQKKPKAMGSAYFVFFFFSWPTFWAFPEFPVPRRRTLKRGVPKPLRARRVKVKPLLSSAAHIWSDETKIELFGLNGQASCLEETRHCSSPGQYHSYREARWWQHHAVGMFFSGRNWETIVRIEGKMNAAMYRDILDENMLQSAQDLRLGLRFIFQQDNDPNHTAKITKEWLRDSSVNVLEWPSQSPDLNPIEHLWRELKMAVHRRSPSNLMELERLCKEE